MAKSANTLETLSHLTTKIERALQSAVDVDDSEVNAFPNDYPAGINRYTVSEVSDLPGAKYGITLRKKGGRVVYRVTIEALTITS